MDLSADLSRPPEIAGSASGRICCDPAFGFAEQPARWRVAPVNPHILCNAGAAECRFASGEANVFEGAACAVGMTVGERNRFLDGCLKVQEDERLRLGRELHDSTGQLLLALRLNVAQLKRVQRTPVEAGLIDEIEDMASQIDREIRSFAFLHYPAEIDRCGLCETLDSLARGFAARTGLRVNFVKLCDRVESGPEAMALLRVAQEALLNVHRHARALHVRMALILRNQLLQLVVRDDGIGIPPAADVAKSHGVGLLGMRHRVERLGGHFSIKRLKHGTKVVAAVPLA